MKACLVLAALFLVSLGSRADVVSTYYSEFEGQSIDVDGDGVPEIANSWFDFEQQRFYVSLNLDYTDIPGTYALADGKTFAGALFAAADSRDALRSAEGFEVDFVPPNVLQRQERWPIAGYFSVNEEHPIYALWFYGTRGRGTEPFHLVAVILDATEYFSDDSVPFIHIHYHDYGLVTQGGAPFVVSLADTGFSTELDESFEAGSEFDGLRRLRYFIAQTRPGWRYQIHRRGPGGFPEVVKEVTGTGKGMILEWDDRARNSRSAFFWLKEESAVELETTQ